MHPFLLCKNTVVSSGLRNNSTYKQFNGGFLSPPFPFNMEPSSVVSKGDLSFPTKPPLPQAFLPYYSRAAKFSQMEEDRIWQSLYQFPNPSSYLSKVWALAASEHFHSSSATWGIQQAFMMAWEDNHHLEHCYKKNASKVPRNFWNRTFSHDRTSVIYIICWRLMYSFHGPTRFHGSFLTMSPKINLEDLGKGWEDYPLA